MATAREQLAQFAAGSKALGRLCREYKNRSATVHLEELVGGALSFYAAAAVAESGGVHVFVAEDRDAAAYLLNDFYNLLDERQVYFFPSSWKRSAAYGAEDAQGVVQRTATMHAVRNFSGKGYLVVCTCPEALAERVADAGKRTEAVSIMIVGMTVANLFGVPLGTYISGVVTWRATFGIVAVWGAVAMLLVKLWVPALPALPDTGMKGQFRFLKSAAPWLVLASVMLGNGGIFCWYSYVSPLMVHTSGFRSEDLTLIVMLAGFGMFAGNIVGGHYADRFTPERVVRFTLGTACLALVGIFFGAHVRYLSLALMCLTTACLFCVSSPQQLLILENSRGGEMLGAALVQVAFNLGNALGAYVGGLPIGHGLGYEYTALPGAAFVLLGMTAAMIYIRKYPRHEQR